MDWSQVNWMLLLLQVARETVPVILVLVSAATIGFGIGRLLRGRKPH
ncbi:hypothetical protein V4C53_23245 [Paraburkholderia azotifigens]